MASLLLFLIIRQREDENRIAIVGMMNVRQQGGGLAHGAAPAQAAFDGDILFAVHRIADDMALRAGGKPGLPQGTSRERLKGANPAVEVADKSHPAIGGQHAREERCLLLEAP